MSLPTHHLYIHVPFCRLVCAYCDFVTVGGRRAEIPRYVEALLAELALRPASGELATIYLGGGTPSLLPGRRRCAAGPGRRWTDGGPIRREITLEANPSARETPDWAGLRAAGVNRISLGIQSLRDDELWALARGQTAAEGLAAFAAARAAGFTNVSVDLIYGIPGQSEADWRDGLSRALALEPDHLSLYALQLALAPDEWAAPPRPGALRWRQRMVPRQDDGLAAAPVPARRGAARPRRLRRTTSSRPGRGPGSSRAITRRTGSGGRTRGSGLARIRSTARPAPGTSATWTRYLARSEASESGVGRQRAARRGDARLRGGGARAATRRGFLASRLHCGIRPGSMGTLAVRGRGAGGGWTSRGCRRRDPAHGAWPALRQRGPGRLRPVGPATRSRRSSWRALPRIEPRSTPARHATRTTTRGLRRDRV